jgi:hypothetical protein
MGKVRDIDKGWKKVIKSIYDLNGAFTKVGVQQGTPSDTPGVDMVTIAAANEFGNGSIPARPFMANAFEKNKQNLYDIAKKQYAKVLDNQEDPKRALGLIGAWYQAKVQLEIRNGSFAPLSLATIAAKGSSKPLIDTGQMINSIRHVEVVK